MVQSRALKIINKYLYNVYKNLKRDSSKDFHDKENDELTITLLWTECCFFLILTYILISHWRANYIRS